MKTILYQPLFINPQAYFVFPQLYHIEKGDSYIEPANITGQLIINDLTQSLTSTPILNNEQTIYPGDKQDTDTLFIGTIRKDDSRSFIGCHGDILLFNRTLTDDELSVIKEVVFGISDIKDALLTVDKKYIKLNDNNYIKLNK